MNCPTAPRDLRVLFAAVAATTTLLIFSTIVSVAEPQRQELRAAVDARARLAAGASAPAAPPLAAATQTPRTATRAPSARAAGG